MVNQTKPSTAPHSTDAPEVPLQWGYTPLGKWGYLPALPTPPIGGTGEIMLTNRGPATNGNQAGDAKE